MAKKQFSSSMFWAKHIALALVLVIIAAVVIHLNMNNESQPLPEGATQTKSISKGLSDFYREFRLSASNPILDDISDFVMELGNNDESLDQRLQEMSSELRPVSNRWVGEHKYRTFKAGNTVREAISAYAQQEGMQLIWNLNQDFVIKHQFQMDNTIAGSLSKIASAIDSNFEGDVHTYLCPKQRTLVITAEDTEFLKKNCTQVRNS